MFVHSSCLECILRSRILYISQWYWPEPTTHGLEFARELRDRGHEVEVLTGFPNYPTGQLAAGYRLSWYMKEEIGGLIVHRVFLWPAHGRSSFGRILNYISFFASSLIFCLRHAGRFDLMYVYHPPITSGLAAAIAGFLKRRPFMLEVQDLWPNSVAASGLTASGAIARVLDPVCRFVYRHASMVLGQSKGMLERLVERGVSAERADVFYNWADEDAARPSGSCVKDALGFQGRFNFVYAGNFGVSQALDALIEATHSLALAAPHIQLTLIGDGADRARLQSLVGDGIIRNVQILPGVPPSQIGDILAAADVLVVHLKNDPLFAFTIPSKVQFYLAVGRPILIGVNGEAAQIVTDAGAGISAPPEDSSGIAQSMLQMSNLTPAELDAMGARGRFAYETQFSFRVTIDRIAAHIDRIGGVG